MHCMPCCAPRATNPAAGCWRAGLFAWVWGHIPFLSHRPGCIGSSCPARIRWIAPPGNRSAGLNLPGSHTNSRPGRRVSGKLNLRADYINRCQFVVNSVCLAGCSTASGPNFQRQMQIQDGHLGRAGLRWGNVHGFVRRCPAGHALSRLRKICGGTKPRVQGLRTMERLASPSDDGFRSGVS